MEKRKSNGGDGGDVRASKRLKIVGDHTHETPESTKKAGLEFLELIRSKDNKLSKHFETLPPRKSNEAYYKRVRMPIALSDIEAKLHRHEFATLTELESYIARMVQNAKDFHPKHSPQAEDAERIRKAASSFMTQHNPAYKLNPGYKVVATPVAGQDEAEEDGGEGEGEGDGEDAGDENEGDDEGDDNNNDNDNDDNENNEDNSNDNARRTPARRKSSAPSRVVMVSSSSRDTPSRAVRKTSAAPSGSKLPDHEYAGVPYKGLTFQQAQEKIVEEIVRRPDEEDPTYAYFEPFFNLPPRTLKDYFQVIKDPLSIKKLQKLVKGIRSRTERSGVTEYKSWAAFEEKASLLWENAYFYNEDGSAIANMAKELETMFRDELQQAKAVVAEPPQPKIKIKKGTAAAKEAATAKETATATAKETPTSSKKITIHVANTRGHSVDSPKSKGAGGGAAAAAAPVNGTPARGAARKASPSPAAAAAPAAAPAPVVAAAKRESSSRASPALSQNRATANGVETPAPAPDTAPNTAPTNGTPSVNGSLANGSVRAESAVPAPPPAPVVPARPAYESKFRPLGSEPLLTKISLRTNCSLVCPEPRFDAQVPPHPKLTQRSLTLNLPPGQWRQHLVVTLHPAIISTKRPFKMYIISNGAMLAPSLAPPQLPLPPQPANATAIQIAAAKAAEATGGELSDPAGGSKLYDVNLHPGVNVIQVQVIAGLAPGQPKLSNGADAELEKVTIFANLMKA